MSLANPTNRGRWGVLYGEDAFMPEGSSHQAPPTLVLETLFACLVQSLGAADPGLVPMFCAEMERAYNLMGDWEPVPTEARAALHRVNTLIKYPRP